LFAQKHTKRQTGAEKKQKMKWYNKNYINHKEIQKQQTQTIDFQRLSKVRQTQKLNAKMGKTKVSQENGKDLKVASGDEISNLSDDSYR